MRRIWRTAASAAVVALVVAATAVATASGGGSAGVTIALAGQDWPTLDIQVQSPTLNYWEMGLYDNLVALDAKGNFVPYVATSWKATPRAVTFQIRKDVKCSDGTILKPSDIAASFKRLIEVPKLTNVIPQDFGNGPFAVTADDKKGTFTFRTGTPYRGLLAGFSDGEAGIICPAGLKAVQATPNALETKVYGSGPYTLQSAEHANQAVLTLRPDWKWGPLGRTSKDLPDTLVFKISTNPTTIANQLLDGELNIATVSGPDVQRLLSNTSLTHTVIPIYLPMNLAFNENPGHPTTDANLREALSMVVDKNAWNQTVFQGRSKPVSSIIYPGQPCYDPKTVALNPKYDIDGAKAVLTKAGYKYDSGGHLLDSSGNPVKLLVVTSSSTHGSGGEYLQAQFQKLGIDVTLQQSPLTYSAAMLGQRFDVGVSATNNATHEPEVHLGFYYGKTTTEGGQSIFGPYHDFTLDRYVRLAASTIGAESCKWFKLVQERYLTQHYILPLVQQFTDVFTSKNLTFVAGPRIYDPVTFKVTK
jgi:peptide/nickel transport system substrate-binding protein